MGNCWFFSSEKKREIVEQADHIIQHQVFDIKIDLHTGDDETTEKMKK